MYHTLTDLAIIKNVAVAQLIVFFDFSAVFAVEECSSLLYIRLQQ